MVPVRFGTEDGLIAPAPSPVCDGRAPVLVIHREYDSIRMSLPGPMLPPTSPTEPRAGEGYTPQYFAREQPDRPVREGNRNPYYRSPYLLATILVTLLALAVLFFFLERL
jgi:hypothetical protein